MGGGDVAIFALRHDHRNVDCTIEKFKECEERFYIVLPGRSLFSKDLYMSLVTQSEATEDNMITTLQTMITMLSSILNLIPFLNNILECY